MQPQDIPRKQASRTTLVKNCRKITLAANQRILANSKNRTRNPVRNRLSPSVRTLIMRGSAAVYPRSLSSNWAPMSIGALLLESSQRGGPSRSH